MWQAGDVMTWRHAEYGTGLELWQGSFGWFDYTGSVSLLARRARYQKLTWSVRYPANGTKPIVLCDTWAVQVRLTGHLTRHFALTLGVVPAGRAASGGVCDARPVCEAEGSSC